MHKGCCLSDVINIYLVTGSEGEKNTFYYWINQCKHTGYSDQYKFLFHYICMCKVSKLIKLYTENAMCIIIFLNYSFTLKVAIKQDPFSLKKPTESNARLLDPLCVRVGFWVRQEKQLGSRCYFVNLNRKLALSTDCLIISTSDSSQATGCVKRIEALQDNTLRDEVLKSRFSRINSLV